MYGRLWFRLALPRLDLSPAPPLRVATGVWRVPACRRASLIGPSSFRFLNEEGSLAGSGWEDSNRSKLWRYNQHYFDDLNAEGAAQRHAWHYALILDWIASNHPEQSSGWEPYPTSLRIVNWVKWALAGNTLPDIAIASLAVQARWLSRRLEWHLLGNHLFANAKALVFAGLFFDGPEAQAWLHKGEQILQCEIPEQILPDGGQFELSPMYHALAVEDMLDLINVAEAYGRGDLSLEWRDRIPDMLAWLNAMSHPDGRISFFNDAASGVAPDNIDIIEYSQRFGFINCEEILTKTYLKDSGYVRMSLGQFVLIADLARVGPSYLAGHAHADTLSFELSFAGHRIFVNSGTSEYGTGPERQRQRGTAAHNTVVVAGENSSEVWAGFRVGRRAKPLGVMVGERDGVLHAEASHDGYRYLRNAPTTHRSFDLDSNNLTVNDTVFPPCPAEARYHLHPAIRVDNLTVDGAVLVLPDGQHLLLRFEGGPPRLENTTWHPEFGSTEPNLCLAIPLANGQACLILSLV